MGELVVPLSFLNIRTVRVAVCVCMKFSSKVWVGVAFDEEFLPAMPQN